MLRLLNLGGWATGIHWLGYRTPSVVSLFAISRGKIIASLRGIELGPCGSEPCHNPSEFVTLDP